MTHQRLYVSDLDGTLLDRQGQLSAATRAGLTELLHQGLAFTVASARHAVSIRQLLAGLPLRLPVISSNGAFLADMATGAYEWVQGMPPDVARELLALVLRQGQAPVLAVHMPEGDRLYWHRIDNPGQQAFVDERVLTRDPRLRHSPDLDRSLQGQLITLVVIAEHAVLAALQADLVARFGDALESHINEDLYVPAWPWLTVHDRGATKDQAIQRMADRYDLAGHELVVFGDQVNDVRMLRAADRGIAMANAIDEVKQVAHRVIGHHDDDAVLAFLRSETAPR